MLLSAGNYITVSAAVKTIGNTWCPGRENVHQLLKPRVLLLNQNIFPFFIIGLPFYELETVALLLM